MKKPPSTTAKSLDAMFSTFGIKDVSQQQKDILLWIANVEGSNVRLDAGRMYRAQRREEIRIFNEWLRLKGGIR